jgi:phytol kinase
MGLLPEDSVHLTGIAFNVGRELRDETGKRKRLKYVAGIVLVIALVTVIITFREMAAVVVVVVLAFFSLAGSNFLYDRGVSRSISRRFAPVIGGFAYMVAVLYLDAWIAIGVTGALTLIIVTLRLGYRNLLRGVRGNHPAQNWAEITFPVSCTISLIIGWGILGNPWLAFLPAAFVAWGDTAAGLARDCISADHAPSIWTMAAMLVVCLIAATVFHPYWVAACGAIIATLAERFRPGIIKFWDDNLNIVATSLTVMAIMLEAF